MTHFYLTLRSDLSAEAPYVIAMSKFTTTLPERMELHDDWEVGLSEISVPSMRHNIYSHLHYLDIGRTRLKIRDNLCETVEDVLHQLVKSFNEWRSNRKAATIGLYVVNTREDATQMVARGLVGFYYVRNIEKVGFYLRTNHRFKFSNDLANVLGFSPDVTYYTRSAGFTVGEYKANIRSNRPFKTAYVYTNIIEPVVVGDAKVRLLRTVEIDGSRSDVVHRVFPSPIYLPLQTKDFDAIEINIMSDAGEFLPFLQGKSTVVLHFKRVVEKYLSV